MKSETEWVGAEHGRHAESPAEIPPAGWKDILWRLYHEINDDRTFLVAAGVTYYMLLALVPALSVFVSLYGLFNDRSTIGAHLTLLMGVMPSGGIDILKDQLTRLTSTPNSTLSLTLVISLIVALWSASSGIKALFDAMNIAYDETEKRNFFALNLLALAFTIGAAFAAIIFLSVVVVMPVVFNALFIGKGFEWLIQGLSYLLMIALMFAGVGALYRWGPSRQQAKWRWLTPGAILTVVITALVSVLFSWYAASFGNYNATYGSLGGLVGLLTWMWLSITILLIGAELNSEVEHQTARDSTTGAPRPLGDRGAEMADRVAVVGPGATPDGKGRVGGVALSHGGGGTLRRERPKRLSLGILAVAVPAALVLSWSKKHQDRRRS
jgi:membrane protein